MEVGVEQVDVADEADPGTQEAQDSDGTHAHARAHWPSSTCGCLRFFVLGELFTGAKSVLHWVNTDPGVFAPAGLEDYDATWSRMHDSEGNIFAQASQRQRYVTTHCILKLANAWI